MKDRTEELTLTTWLSDKITSEKVQYYPANASQPILLKEKDRNVNMTVKIVDVNETVTSIRLDKIQHLSSIRSGLGLTRVCDYLLVTQVRGKYHAFFVELMKTLNEDISPREQLRRSPPLLHYFLSVFRIDTGLRLAESKVDVGYLLIGDEWNKHVDKQAVRFDPKKVFVIEEYKSIKIRKSVARAILFEDLLKG